MEDETNDMVKVHYIGYGNEHNEWRSRSDIVELNGEESESNCDELESHDGETTSVALTKRMNRQFCLYDELRSRIKSLLSSQRKADPVCHISMSFDTIYFEGLIRRSKILPTSQRSKKQVNTLPTLSKLDDILGSRWYIRGINEAGDFCFITPGSQVSLKKQAKQS